MSDRAIIAAVGSTRGASRAAAQSSYYGTNVGYRLAENDHSRITEDGADYRITDAAITLASVARATGMCTVAATGIFTTLIASDANAAGSGAAAAEGAATAAANGAANGTGAAAAISTAEVPPIVIILPAAGVRVRERVIAARGHAVGTSTCAANGRAIVAGSGRAEGMAAVAAEGIARRYLHDDELFVLLEAA